MKVYVASSWRNAHQPAVVDLLRSYGHDVYDFRNPPNGSGFAWRQIDERWENWTGEKYRQLLLTSPIAAAGYISDFRAMKRADVGLLVMPCGRSAHLELGWMAGAGKRTIICLPEACEPELMNLLADEICLSIEEACRAVGDRFDAQGRRVA